MMASNSTLNSIPTKLGAAGEAPVNSITLCVILLVASVLIGHLLQNSRWITEFKVKKKQFFRNFMEINLYGVVGSMISFFIISLGSIQLLKNLDIGYLELGDYFALGAVFSATDSVCTLQVLNQEETPLLYSLVFGEGVVNDATSVVGLLCAFIIKKLYIGRHSTDREIALMILMAYLSYMLAELLNLSGILTVFFCGILMSHYSWHNVTESSRVTSRHAFATFSFVSEIFIFLYVGMDALDIEKWRIAGNSPWSFVGASAMLLGLVVIGRAAFVFPLSYFANLFRKSRNDKIAFKQQVVIWWAGLMRGAVSVALAYNKFTRSGHTQLRGNAIMITSTITVVVLTNVKATDLSSIKSESECVPLLSSSEQDSEYNVDSGNSGDWNPSVHHYWRIFDNAVMRPVFGGRGFVPVAPLSSDNLSLLP
ncbi:sodium/hydrogen exchanger 2-like [Senna tora]|uniref:Sodium/hydrogen exchanger 2-like n=1 Tax=Senna tora TaxID=362788 RepID=A0A834TBI4_9FABA|nr:sodium/hydrogen exchanger 2-like [Senna tora]